MWSGAAVWFCVKMITLALEEGTDPKKGPRSEHCLRSIKLHEDLFDQHSSMRRQTEAKFALREDPVENEKH